MCPFCHQWLSERNDLIDIYKEFFDKNYEELFEELKRYNELYKWYNFDLDIRNIEIFIENNKILYKYWNWKIKLKNFYDTKLILELLIEIKSIHKEIVNDLENKLKNLNSDFDNSNIDILIEKVSKANIFINEFNISIDEINKLIVEYKKTLTKINIENLEAEKDKIQIQLQRITPEEIKKVEEYETKSQEISDTTKLIGNKRTELNTYTKTIIDDYEKLINQKLLDLWINSFEIWHIENTTHVNGSFVEIIIKMNWELINIKEHEDEIPSFKNTLSKWDKNSLAFAFFLSYIETIKNKSDLIIIYDDPLSSHDENRQRQTVKQIHLISNEVKQTIILTHKIDFLTILNKIFNNTSIYLNIKKSRAFNRSSIENLDIWKFLSSEYEKTIERLEEFLNDTSSSTIWNIQNDLRKIFEDILKLKYYRILKSEKRTIFTYNTLNDNFFIKWMMLNVKNDLIDIANYVNDWSHFTSVSWNENELCWYIEKSLETIEKI